MTQFFQIGFKKIFKNLIILNFKDWLESAYYKVLLPIDTVGNYYIIKSSLFKESEKGDI